LFNSPLGSCVIRRVSTGNAISPGRVSRDSDSPLSLRVKFGYGIGDFAFNLVLQSTSLFLIYFFTDVFLIGAAAAASIPLFLWISNRRSKRFAFALGMGLLGLLLIPLYLFGEGSTVLTVAIFVAAGLGMSTIYLRPWSMIPDTVEYSEWKTGLRREGILYGAFFFCFKAGAALAGALVGLGLDLSGYRANVAQTAETLEGIRILISLVPLGLIVPGVIVIRFYSITAERHRQIVAEIHARNQTAAPLQRRLYSVSKNL
jgi:Na+/melibiose symporter-like transporter